MNEIEAIRWHLERYRAMLAQQIDRLYNALEELQRTTLMLLDHNEALESEIDEWLMAEGFGVDGDGFFQSLPLLKAFKDGTAPGDAISVSWGKHLYKNITARRHMYAHRGIGHYLKHIHQRLSEVGWIYYQDASNTALQYPYIEQRSAIKWDFDWSAYHTYVSVNPENNPDRMIKWTLPTIDYAGEGLILSVSIPVWRGDDFIGLWSIDLPIRYLYRDFGISKPFDDQIQFIVNTDGMLLLLHESMNADIEPVHGNVLLQPLTKLGGGWATLDLQQAIKEEQGELRVTDEAGVVWLMSFTTVPGVEWILFSGIKEQVMEKVATHRLRRAFRQVAEGDFTHKIETASSGSLLSSVADEFNRMLLRLEASETRRNRAEAQLLQAQRMECIGGLAGGVAHDYNNMLSVILGYTELAFEKVNRDDPLYDDLNEIYKAGKRSMEITRQLLAFARRQPIAPMVLDMNESISSMLKMLRRLIGENIELVWRPGEKMWAVKIDPSQIDQLLANLCVNARDAIDGVGTIIIETENVFFDDTYCDAHQGFIPGEYVALTVSDDGVGIQPEKLGSIFEPFFTTKEVGRGTGLGLATVYGIVKQNNGFINVYSETGKGTTFRIYLPGKGDMSVDKGIENIENILTGDGEVLMLVEDEISILKFGRKMLEGLGYVVLVSQNPLEAIKMAEMHPDKIDLVITDVIMPEMNGRDLADELQRIYPDIKILFMSGYTANVIEHRGVLEKNVNFLQKPFSRRDMAIKIREALLSV